MRRIVPTRLRVDRYEGHADARLRRIWYERLVRWPLLLALLAACAHTGRPTGRHIDLLVLAPHPDDEVLMAAGQLRRAVTAGQRVAVVVVTNGDLTCARDGRVRQNETIAALESLGVTEADVHFLGYPDGYLHELGAAPLVVSRVGADGACREASTTWASRGAGGVDEHTRRTRRAGLLTAPGLVEDLAALLSELRPADVVVPHGIDTHHDHAMTYVFLRRALDRTGLTPRLHRSVIHATKPCWPGDCSTPRRLDLTLPPLPAPLDGYTPDERLPIDANAKLGAIAFFRSQLDDGLEADWLTGFARRDERFFVERCERRDARVTCSPPDATVECDASTCRSRRADGYEETSVWVGSDFTRLSVRPASTEQ